MDSIYMNYTTTSHDSANIDNIITFSQYYEIFEFKFNEIHSKFNIINPNEIQDFMLMHDDLIDYIEYIEPLIRKYFPNHDYNMEFVEDSEFTNLNQIIISIDVAEDTFDENWDLLEKLENEIDTIDNFSYKSKSFVILDL